MSCLDLRDLTKSELEKWVQDLGLPRFRANQIFRWVWTPGIYSFDQMTNLSKVLRSEIGKRACIGLLRKLDVQASKDGTIKFAWLLKDGHIVESVLIPERNHYTLCLSTQVGCAMGCVFCHTAKMGFKRNLTSGEIATQALAALEHSSVGSEMKNLVFMGMGEPLANYENLINALQILTDDHGLNFSWRRITVSTCGLVPQMLRLGQETNAGLAVSLHAPDDELRSRLMPVNKRFPLNELIEGCRRYPLSKRRRITFEYILLGGINDSIDHARRLAKLLRGIRSKINLIPYNHSPDLPFKSPASSDVEAFRKELLRHNYTAIVRKSKGTDIKAACGQLYAEHCRPEQAACASIS